MIVCPHCGKQIKLTISQSSSGPIYAPDPAALPPLPLPLPAVTPPRQGDASFLKTVFWLFLPAFLLLGAGSYFWYFHLRTSPLLAPYADVLPGDAIVVFEMKLAEIAGAPGFETEAAKLAKAHRTALRDLDLEPRSAGLLAYFAALTQDEHSLFVWSFDQPVAFGKSLLKGRFREVAGPGRRVLADRYRPKMHWTIDARGRVLHGPLALLQAALDQQASGVASSDVGSLGRSARSIPGTPALWLVADLAREAKAAHALLPSVLASELQEMRINELACYASHTEEQGFVMKGNATCPTTDDCQNTLAALQKVKKSFNKLTAGKLETPEWRLLGKFLANASFDIDEKTVEMEMPVPVALARQALDQQTAGIVARHKAVIQAIRKDIRDLSAQADKDLAAEKFKEAESAQSRVVDLAPSNAAAQAKLKEITAAREKKERFLACLAAFEKAVRDLDANVARSNFTEAHTLRGHDPAIPELEKKLAALVKRLDFNKVVAEGDKALAKKDFTLAAEKFTGAAAFGLDADKIKATLDGIRRLVKAASHLQDASKQLESKKIDEVLALADKIKEAILAGRRAAIEADTRFQETAEKLGADTLALLVATAKAARLPGQALTRRADKLFGDRSYADAEKDYRGALKFLQHAKDVLAKVPEFNLKDALGAAEAENRLVDFDVKAITREADKCKGMAAHQRGKALAKEGREQFELGKKDGALLFKAQEKFQQAVKCFEDSVAVPGILAADDLKEARGYLQRVTRMIEPLDLDFAKKRDLLDWGPLPKGWRFQGSKALTWLQTDLDAPTGVLSSPLLELPTDFTLRLHVCLVDDTGEVRNNAWKSFADLLSITLVTRGDKNLTMSLGRDPKSRQLETALAIGSRTHALALDNMPGPIPLVISRKQEQLAIEVAGRAVARAPAPGDIQRIIFHVRNGPGPNGQPRYFPAFMSIALSLSTKSEKVEPKETMESTSRAEPVKMNPQTLADSPLAVSRAKPRAN